MSSYLTFCGSVKQSVKRYLKGITVTPLIEWWGDYQTRDCGEREGILDNSIHCLGDGANYMRRWFYRRRVQQNVLSASFTQGLEGVTVVMLSSLSPLNEHIAESDKGLMSCDSTVFDSLLRPLIPTHTGRCEPWRLERCSGRAVLTYGWEGDRARPVQCSSGDNDNRN